MYEIIKTVINSGRFELTDILKKIDTLWVQGDLTEEEKTELVALAQKNANPENSFAPLQDQIDKLAKNQSLLEKRVYALEHPQETIEPTEEYPEYKQPTGAHDAYYNGDKVTYNSEKYVCIAPEGTPCVWSPDEYPSYWQKVEDEVEALN